MVGSTQELEEIPLYTLYGQFTFLEKKNEYLGMIGYHNGNNQIITDLGIANTEEGIKLWIEEHLVKIKSAFENKNIH